jgi:hypothetical protein
MRNSRKQTATECNEEELRQKEQVAAPTICAYVGHFQHMQIALQEEYSSCCMDAGAGRTVAAVPPRTSVEPPGMPPAPATRNATPATSQHVDTKGGHSISVLQCLQRAPATSCSTHYIKCLRELALL